MINNKYGDCRRYRSTSVNSNTTDTINIPNHSCIHEKISLLNDDTTLLVMNELLNASLHKNSKIISETHLPRDSISGFLEDSLPTEFLVNFFQCPTLIFPRAMLISLCPIMEWKSVKSPQVYKSLPYKRGIQIF